MPKVDMLNNLKRTILVALSALTLAVALPAASHALDCTKDSNATACSIQGGVNTANGGADTTSASSSVSHILTNVINIFSLVIGIIAVIVIIIAGLRYITSGGDSGATASAKNTILYAVIGLIIVASAQLIVKIAIHAGDSTSNVPVTNAGPGTCQGGHFVGGSNDGQPCTP